MWLYSKYQHLGEPPQSKIGDRVKAGDIIARSGRTGTVGGHYGGLGYPHLHLSLYAGRADDAEQPGGSLPPNICFVDPLALYAGKSLDSHVLRGLPEAEKRFAVPYKTADGVLNPPGTRVVWPLMCRRR